jgi:hypothetical protein
MNLRSMIRYSINNHILNIVILSSWTYMEWYHSNTFPLQVHNIRPKMVSVLRERFTHLNLTFSIGGQISFDVSL